MRSMRDALRNRADRLDEGEPAAAARAVLANSDDVDPFEGDPETLERVRELVAQLTRRVGLALFA